jgi:hypothetical protein
MLGDVFGVRAHMERHPDVVIRITYAAHALADEEAMASAVRWSARAREPSRSGRLRSRSSQASDAFSQP